jgi:hypothetical protein
MSLPLKAKIIDQLKTKSKAGLQLASATKNSVVRDIKQNPRLYSTLADLAGTIAIQTYLHKGLKKEISKSKKKLTSKDIKNATKAIGLKKDPVIIREGYLSGSYGGLTYSIDDYGDKIIKHIDNSDKKLAASMKKKFDKVKGQGRHAIHMGTDNHDLGVLGHEMGHIKLREVLDAKLGKRLSKAVQLTRAGSGVEPFVNVFKGSPLSGKEVAARTAMHVPTLVDEFTASAISAKKLKKVNKKALKKAFMTYGTLATSPIKQKVFYEMIKNIGDK